MKNAKIQLLASYYNPILLHLACASSAMILIVRLWIAHVFWASGIVKIQDFSTTVLLFTNEHPVPYMPPMVAAIFSTAFELSCPALLTLGLAARIATLPLLVMTAIINFTYDNATEHYYWAMLLGMILCYGPGKISLDYWISKKINHS